MTIQTFTSNPPWQGERFYLYSGTACHFSHCDLFPYGVYWAPAVILIILDFPFSFALDTILLPVTAPHTAWLLYKHISSQNEIKRHNNEIRVQEMQEQSNFPLHTAAKNREIERVMMLIDQGADVNARDSQGRTPLMMTRSEVVAQLLTEHGADMNAKDPRGHTALMRIILDNSGPTSIFPYSDIYILKWLVAHGADINVKNDQGTPAVGLVAAFSCSPGQLEILRLLIEKRAEGWEGAFPYAGCDYHKDIVLQIQRQQSKH